MRTYKKNHEQGVALVAVMLVLLLVTAMAAGIIILTNTESNTSTNFRDEQRAYFAAKAGIEEARDRLVTGNSGYTLTTVPTTLPGVSSTGVLYITNPLNSSETVAPWCAGSSSSSGVSSTCKNQFPDDELCKEALAGSAASLTGTVTCTTDTTTGKQYASGSYYLTSVGASSLLQPSSGALDWKWARITLKQNNAFGSGYYVNGNSASAAQTYWNGNHECISGTACTLPVYVITALAVTPSKSRRMVQMEVAQDQLIFNAPSALTLDGTSDSFSGGSSNNYQINGNDQGGCGSSAGAPAVPAVGVNDGAKGSPNTGDVNTVIDGIPNGRMSNYLGLGSSPDVENISSSLPNGINSNYDLSTVAGLQTMVSAIKTAVTQPVITGPASYSGSAAALGSTSASNGQQIVYVNGDLTLDGNANGYGILVVTGKLTVKGTVQWNGLVLVVGNGNLQMDGTNTFAGAVVVAKTKDSSGNALSTMGSPTFGVHGGGNANGGVFYSASCLAKATQLTTFHSVSFRELLN